MGHGIKVFSASRRLEKRRERKKWEPTFQPCNPQKGCKIADPAYRGITLGQLVTVWNTVKERCQKEGWKSTQPGSWKSKFLTLNPEQATLYDLVEYVIKPDTLEKRCSYVESIAQGPQRPEWFVSHWWGDTVYHFLQCLEEHARDRCLTEATTYWVCAYALNQHNTEHEIGENPQEFPFYKAMALSKGTVSILDPGAVTFNRIWCFYEISLALTANDDEDRGFGRERYLYDVYTIGDSNRAVGFTDGAVGRDKSKGSVVNPLESAWRIRANRESLFPTKLCKKVLAIRLETSKSSREVDRKRILNFISGNTEHIDSDPPTTNSAYDKINAMLKGKFAVSAYRRAVDEGLRLEQFRKAISLSGLTRLDMSFYGVKEFRLEARRLITSLPKSLVELNLDLSRVGFQTSDEYAEGLSQLPNLKTLRMEVEGSNLNLLGREIGALSELQELYLNLDRCPISSAEGLGTAMTSLKSLGILKLSAFGHTTSMLVADVASRLAAKDEQVLKQLELGTSVLEQASMDMLGTALATMSNLQELTLVCNKCSASSLWNLTFGLPSGLEGLSLLLGDCGSLTSFDGVGAAIWRMSSLRRFSLMLASHSISSIDEIKNGLAMCGDLESLDLNFFECSKLPDDIVSSVWNEVEDHPNLHGKVLWVKRGSRSYYTAPLAVTGKVGSNGPSIRWSQRPQKSLRRCLKAQTVATDTFGAMELGEAEMARCGQTAAMELLEEAMAMQLKFNGHRI